MARKRIRVSALAATIHGRTWAMMEPALRALEARARATSLTPKALAAVLGRPLEGTSQATYRDGVCTIPIRGDLVCYEDLWCWFGYATAYETIARDLQVAMADPKVAAILLAVDSRGGEYAGGVDLAQLIARARAVKPVVAHISGVGASAGYLIAAAAGSVRISSSALAGCLGTMLAFWNTEKMDEALGIEEVVLVSSQTPNKHPDPSQADGRAQLQRMLDAQAAVMLEVIADARAVTVEDLLTNSGRGDVLVGAAAVTAGLADAVQSYEEVHAELVAAVAAGTFPLSPTPAPSARALSHRTEALMSTAAQPAAAPAASAAAPAAPPRLTAEQLQAEYGQELTQIRASAAQAERERITAIQALPAAGVEAVRTACLADPTCSVDQAGRRILEAQAAQAEARGASTLAGLQGDEARLTPPAPDVAAGQPQASTDAEVTRILATHRTLGGRPALPAGTPPTRRTV